MEHIITDHVEVGLGTRQASGQGRQDGDARARFSGEQLRDFLIQLHLGHNDADVISFDGFDQRMQMARRGLSSRLR